MILRLFPCATVNSDCSTQERRMAGPSGAAGKGRLPVTACSPSTDLFLICVFNLLLWKTSPFVCADAEHVGVINFKNKLNRRHF